MNKIKLTVHPFRMGTNIEAAEKLLEEANEAYESWDVLDDTMTRGEEEMFKYISGERLHLADKLADVIQAVCNLADRYDIDLVAAMERCKQRNRDMGWYEW